MAVVSKSITLDILANMRKKAVTNCKNCAAPLKNHLCEYCGTNYRVGIDQGIPSGDKMVMAEYKLGNGIVRVDAIKKWCE